MDKVAVVFSHHYQDHKPEDRVTIDADEARRLVRGGRATYAAATQPKRVRTKKAGAVKKAAPRSDG